MIKKYSKFLLTALFVFFISLTGVSARELTVEQLADFVKEIEPNATYVYVIGEYVFTSEHVLTTQDTMLAARSIKVSDNSGDTNNDPIYNEMTIAYLEGVFDTDWNLTGLDYVKNVIGTSSKPNTYDVKYIDYKQIVTNIDVDSLVEKAFKTIDGQGANDKFEISIAGTSINVILNDLNIDSVNALMGTGVATAATNFLNEEGIASVTLAYGDSELKISADNIDVDEINNFFKAIGSKASDLVGKTITAKIAFEEGYKTSNSDEFTLSFTEETKVDVDTLVNEAYKTILKQASEDKFDISKDNQKIKVVLKDLDINSIETLRGTGIYTAATNFLNEEGIESVTLVYGDTELKISANNIDVDEINNFFKAIGSKASDLVGKTITTEIDFIEGYKTANSNEFIIEFAQIEKVDVNSLVDEAYKIILKQAAKDKFIPKLDGTNIEVMLVDLNIDSVNALMGTGVATAATNFLNEEGIASVTLAYGDSELKISADNIDADEINNFFKAIGSKASDLVGKTITAKIAFEEGYKTSNSDEFTLSFTEETKVDVNNLVDEAYKTILKQATKDKFIPKLDGTNIEVMLVDLNIDSVNALMGTGVATAATNFLNEEGIVSVTLAYGDTELKISADNIDVDEINNFFKAIGSKASDLVGKTITAKIAFEEGYKTANSNEFTLSFIEEEKVDVASLATSAYNHISSKENDIFEVMLNGTDIEIFLKDLNASSVDTLAGTGIGKAVIDFLDAEGVKEICLTYNTDKTCFNESNLNFNEVQKFLNKLGNKTSDLVGKNITVEVLFEDGYKSANVNNFIISFYKKEYDVNFNVDGVITNEKVAVGDSVSEPVNPTKEGHTFDKWLLNGSAYDFSTPIDSAITLTASWKVNTYKVNIVPNDTTYGILSTNEITVPYGTEIQILDNSIKIGDLTIVANPTTANTQYTFSFTGWENISTMVKNEMTIIANFNKTVNNYTVTYVYSNNQSLGTEVVAYGTKVGSLTAPSIEGKIAIKYLNGATIVDKNYEIIGDTTLVVEYANEINVDETLSTSLSSINANYYTANLTDDIITANFKDENLKFSNLSFVNEVLDLLSTLTDNSAYKSVKLSYDNDPNHQVEIKGNVDTLAIARFIGLVTTGSYSGSNGMKADVNKLVAATANKPIEVKVTLVDGYADSTGSSIVDYDLVFTCVQ